MSDDTVAELEQVANELDEIADGLSTTNMERARQLRKVVKRIVRIARNVPSGAALEAKE
jgi:hypothetical protein